MNNNQYVLLISGDEILSGRRQDAHIHFLTNALSPIGLQCRQCVLANDKLDDLTNAIRSTFEKADLLIMTGGLGPTVDDLTREALSQAMDIPMRFQPEVLEAIRERFRMMGKSMTENNKRQAFVPVDGFFIPNPNGTAPGLVFDKNDKIAVALPGPPRELEPMVLDDVVPFLKKRLLIPSQALSIQMHFSCIGESTVDQLLRNMTDGDPEIAISLLSRPALVDLKLSYPQDAPAFQQRLHTYAQTISREIGAFLYSEDGGELEEKTGGLLAHRGETLCVAESCTGGLLGAQIVSVPGSSDYFLGGVIAYGNSAKQNLLGVRGDTLQNFGAVSRETACEMALGAIQRFSADWSAAITGIAGPSGGTPQKPVGTVWIAAAHKNGAVYPFCVQFPPGRQTIRQRSVVYALDQLRRLLSQIEPHS
ncbi:MAG: competence/damage-inducible protein A [Candidatus Omnitrophota bacterium]